MKTILCYGDSNTWGYKIGSFDFETGYCERYSPSVRWTRRLQELMGEDYLIVEEGLCGRLTNVDDLPEAGGANSNGKTYLSPCLFSQAPIDWVVLMLGGNDFKTSLNRSPEEVTQGLEELIQVIQSSRYGTDMQSSPQILLLGYPYLNTEKGGFAELFKGADEKSHAFPALCQKLASQYGCAYLDMSVHIELSSEDGLHIDEKDQSKFAELIASQLV